MKKIIYIILIIVLLGTAGTFAYKTFVANNVSDANVNNETENGGITVISIYDVKGITTKEAENLCVSAFGEKDKETGFLFSFGVSGAVERNNKQYYVIRASWLVNNSHMSYIGDYFVSADGKEIYTGIATPPDEYVFDALVWSK